MPTSGDSASNMKAGSFYSLLSQYGVSSSVQGTGDYAQYNIAKAPLYFVRSGYVGINHGRLWLSGIYGYDWSSTASSTRDDGAAVPSGYYLLFDATGVLPASGPRHRWNGFPLRCLSTV